MKLTALKCPNCNGAIDNSECLDSLYCKYCGYHIIMEQLTDTEINAKVAIKNMEHEEKMLRMQINESNAQRESTKEKNIRNDQTKLIFALLLSTIPILIMMFMLLYFVTK